MKLSIKEDILSALPEDFRKEACETFLTPQIATVLENDDFLHIIQAMFEANLVVKKAAALAFMHRNTAAYRIKTILQKTGLDVRKFEDAFMIKLLISLKETGS